ncbi:hypothetical protein ABPG72_008185, partial [Tetrahymena utriculariae]
KKLSNQGELIFKIWSDILQSITSFGIGQDFKSIQAEEIQILQNIMKKYLNLTCLNLDLSWQKSISIEETKSIQTIIKMFQKLDTLYLNLQNTKKLKTLQNPLQQKMLHQNNIQNKQEISYIQGWALNLHPYDHYHRQKHHLTVEIKVIKVEDKTNKKEIKKETLKKFKTENLLKQEKDRTNTTKKQMEYLNSG